MASREQEASDMTLARLQEILAGFGRLHITVVGDLFLDRWWERKFF